MMTSIWRKEWLLLRRDAAVWTTLLCYVALLAWGGYNSVLQVRGVQRGIAAAQADEAERWHRIDAALQKLRTQPNERKLFSDVSSPSYLGGFAGPRYALLPVTELAALSSGEAQPHQARVTTFSRYESGREEIDDPVNAVAGKFDLAFVVIFVLPLALLALSYNLISGERERGTWPLLLSLGLSARALVLAKCLWRMSLALTPTIAAGLLVCWWASGKLFSLTAALQFVIWVLAVTLYAIFWLSLAAIWNARSRHSAVNIIGLIAVWAVVTMIAPNLIHLAAIKRHPPVDRLQIALQAREMNVDRENKLTTLYEWYYAQHPADRPSAELVAAANKPIPGGARSSDSRRTYIPALYLDEQIRPLLAELSARRQARQLTVQWLSLLSPALSLQLLTDDLAGASAFRYDHFAQQTAQFQQAWRAFFSPRIMRLGKMTLDDFADIPAFQPQPEPVAERRHRILNAGLVLTAAALLSVFLAQRRLSFSSGVLR